MAEVLEVLLVEEDEPEEGPGHGPLVATVLEQDDVEDGLKHLLQDLGPHVDDGQQRVTLHQGLAANAGLLACK